MNKLIIAIQVIGLGAVLALAAVGHARAASCHTIFKAGLGYVDSCTLGQRSPYADLPTPTATPQPPAPAPAPQVVIVYQPVYTTKKGVYTPAIATPTPNCYPIILELGRCPLLGEKWVTNSATGQIYPGTSAVPPYSDLTPTALP